MPTEKPIASIESEGAVLGSIFNDPKRILEIIDFLRPDDFYKGIHARIYLAMTELAEADKVIDYASVANRLNEKGELEMVGGHIALVKLAEDIGPAAYIREHAQTVYDKSTLRRLVNIGINLENECKNGAKEGPLEIAEKAEAALKQLIEGSKFRGGKNIAKKIREYFEVTEGNIKVTDLHKNLHLVTNGNKNAAKVALGRLVKEGFISRISPGIYRLIEKEAPRLKLSDAIKMGDEIQMCYPFNLERWFITYPKTVVIVSGEPDAGKTAFLLNVARMNMHLAPIYYWTSEMGLPELYSRVENFEDFIPDQWDAKVEFHERSENFADVVGLYPDAIHIIDNLEMNDNFYLVGGLIDSIWKALDKGVVIIGLHKDKGKDYGLGGMASVKRARMWLDLKPKKQGGNICQVGKFKNWRDKVTNIKNKIFEYHLVKGCKILQIE